jgi:hypothetical protein
MRIIIAFLLMAALLVRLFVSSCDGKSDDTGVIPGSGNIITETRDVTGFSGVWILSTGTVKISVTGEESLVIEAEDRYSGIRLDS